MSSVGAGLIEDPVVSLIGDVDDQWKIIPAKAGRVLPLVTVFIETAERDIVPNSVFSCVFPDSGLTATICLQRRRVCLSGPKYCEYSSRHRLI